MISAFTGITTGTMNSQASIVMPEKSPNKTPIKNSTEGAKSADIEKFVASAAQALSTVNKNVSLEYDKTLDIIKVLIRDGTTNEIIKTIPSESFLQMKLSMHNMIGLLLDEKI